MKSPLRQTAKGHFLHIRATPKSSCNEIAGLRDGALLVRVTAIPDKGMANKAVIETLAKAMRVSKSSFVFSSGETAREKVLEITQNLAAIEAFIKDLHVPE